MYASLSLPLSLFPLSSLPHPPKSSYLSKSKSKFFFLYSHSILKPRPQTPLDAIKFICKDLWTILFRKQIDNLKTNHRGVFVLTDARFQPMSRMSVDRRAGPKAGEEALRRAYTVCFSFSFSFSLFFFLFFCLFLYFFCSFALSLSSPLISSFKVPLLSLWCHSRSFARVGIGCDCHCGNNRDSLGHVSDQDQGRQAMMDDGRWMMGDG